MAEADFAAILGAARQAELEGEYHVALERYERALLQLTRAEDPAAAADVFRRIGAVRRAHDDIELAREAYETSLVVSRAFADDQRIASALNSLGILEQSTGSLTAAESHYVEARALAERAGDDSLVAMLDQNLATLANIRGDVSRALVSYRSARARLELLGEEGPAATVLNNMGMAHVDLGEWRSARACFDRAYEMADRLRDSSLIALIDLNRAELHLRRGQLSEARESCDRAYEVYGRIGSDAGRGEAEKLYGIIAREAGTPFLARTRFDAALELASRCGDPLLEAETEAERAVLFLQAEENREALRSLNRAHQLFSELQARRELHDLDRRLDGLEDTYLEVVERWGASIEAKDRYTAGHCERVAEYACMLAEAVGFEGRDLTWFRMGGFLHDVGKTTVPVEVLNKPGKLTDEEWAVMKAHTTAGYDIVSELRFPWDIAPLVRSHHERWDGGGYPDGLAGEAIPLAARILCVADVYDALTTARSYRSAMTHDRAMEIMNGDEGAFQPELLARFQELIEARRATPRPVLQARRSRARPATIAAM